MFELFYITWWWAHWAIWITGVMQLTWFVVRAASFVHRTFAGTQVSTQLYGPDSWAVVTGATDGIGLGTAKYLAYRGFNIVLVSRTLSKL